MAARAVPQTRRQHVCTICQRQFKRAEHLTRHFRRHTREQPFQCRQCLLCFSRKELHDRHQRKQHACGTGSLPAPNIVAPLDLPPGAHGGALSLQSPTPSTSTSSNVAVAAQDARGRDLLSPNTTPRSWPHAMAAESSPAPDEGGDGASTALGQQLSSNRTSDLQYLGLICSQLNELEGPLLDGNATPRQSRAGIMSSIECDSVALPQGLMVNTPRPDDQQPFLADWSFLDSTEFPPWIVSCDPSREPSVGFGLSGLNVPVLNAFGQTDASLDPSAPELNAMELVRNGMLVTLQGLKDSRSADSLTLHLNIPSARMLQSFLNMFWAVPNRNFPFTHEFSGLSQHHPAEALAILADGAMYCGDHPAGTILFEASRRLVSEHMRRQHPETVPLWLVNTLLFNNVFGLPGGHEPSIDITVGGIENMLWLASRIDPQPSRTFGQNSSSTEAEWSRFVECEAKTRSLLCIQAMAALWQAAYGSINNIHGAQFTSIKLPCNEQVWTASSAGQWKQLYLLAPEPLHLREAVDGLVSGKTLPCSGLTSLSLLVGVMLYTEELRASDAMFPVEMKDNIKTALTTWMQSHDSKRPENSTMNFIVYPAAHYLKLSVAVDMKQAMSCFFRYDFMTMRSILRQGDLGTAAREALDGLVPWYSSHRNQISMVAVPCALVVCESMFMLLERNNSHNAEDASSFALFKTALLTAGQSLTLSNIWQALRRLIGNGPVTHALNLRLDAYAKILV